MKTTALFLLLIFVAAPAAAQDEAVPEIAVTGMARATPEIKAARITASIEASAASAQEAASQVEAKAGKIKEQVLAVSNAAVIENRGADMTAEARGAAAITPQSGVRVVRYVAVTNPDLSKTGQLVDLLLKAGAAAVTQVEYLPEAEGTAKLKAIQEASDQARVKAELLARSLGVKVGSVISAAIDEEPAGELVREQMLRGGEAVRYNLDERMIQLTVRFAVIR